jgi:hypothetical protein
MLEPLARSVACQQADSDTVMTTERCRRHAADDVTDNVRHLFAGG